jgi:hypothetical protein
MGLTLISLGHLPVGWSDMLFPALTSEHRSEVAEMSNTDFE